ncbi:flagellar biosynthesis protein [Piscinibacter sakaiensis]|uniref:MinD/ParA family ATP-binding protein n=1 Tax=Piscinibacter sakaiensis TaxID=1547922 RepID=UPI00372A97AE
MTASRAMPQDQADGLRRLFAPVATRHLPVVSNPHMAFGGVMLERICTALANLGRHTLVVDAGERSPQPRELAALGLAECVEPLSTEVSYLAARGLPLRFVDHRGSTGAFLQAVADAAPQADVILVHAPAGDLCRLFAHAEPGRCAHPLVLSDERPASVTHAYAAMKLLTQRAGLAVHDLLLSAAAGSRRAERIAQQLGRCADDFLGAAVRECLRVDPATAQAADPPPLAGGWPAAGAMAYRHMAATRAMN